MRQVSRLLQAQLICAQFAVSSLPLDSRVSKTRSASAEVEMKLVLAAAEWIHKLVHLEEPTVGVVVSQLVQVTMASQKVEAVH